MNTRIPFTWKQHMPSRYLSRAVSTTIAVAACFLPLRVATAESPSTDNLPVKVYILSGQSNMVGIGQVGGGSVRWSGVTEATVSVYPGPYSATADYDAMKPLKKVELAEYGGGNPTPFPGGGTQVVRGFIELKTSGVYKFTPGYQGSTTNIMELDGDEVYRKEPEKNPRHANFKIVGGQKYPFKITFLTADATGLGWWSRTDIPGTLDTLVKEQGKFPHLINDEGDYVARDDVWYKGLVTATANKPLSIGCGANSNQIGPELQFGHIMGDHHDAPVLILKTSQGNRSLGWDFLPPGSQPFTFDGRTYAGYKDEIPSWTAEDPGKKVNWYAGLQYDQCFEAVHKVLDNFDSEFPQWKGRGYEIAGFAWWQGHKDGNPAHASRYEQNLVKLIHSLRDEFKSPHAPFVIGTIGFGGWDMSGPHLTVANAQLAVSGKSGKHKEFDGNVVTVETRDFWQTPEVSPRNQDFHYNGNAATYMMVGDALGRGMLELQGIQSASR